MSKLDYETPGLKIGACISLLAWIGIGDIWIVP